MGRKRQKNRNAGGGGGLFTVAGVLLLIGALITGFAYFMHSATIAEFVTDGRQLTAQVSGASKVVRSGVGEGSMTRVDDMICVTADALPESDRMICTTQFVSGELVARLTPGTSVKIFYREDIHEMMLADAVDARNKSVFFSYSHLILFAAGLILFGIGRLSARIKSRAR